MVRFLFFAFVFGAVHAWGNDYSARSLVHVLDYISQDYGGAVARGRITSPTEYHEQIDFAESATETAKHVSELQNDPEIRNGLEQLQQLIVKKASPQQVSAVSHALRSRVIKLTRLEVAPSRWPSLKHGQMLYQKNCVICHGQSGDGNGAASSQLNPRPADFLDANRMNLISPFQLFNSIRMGVSGTAMPGFGQLSDKDVWALSFYVASLRHPKTVPTETINYDEALLIDVSTLSDNQLLEKRKIPVAVLRLHTEGDDPTTQTLEKAKDLIKNAQEKAHGGDWKSAKQTAILAYLDGVEPVEPKLRAINQTLTFQLEQKMADVRASIEKQFDREELDKTVGKAIEKISEAQSILSEQSSPWFTFSASAAILLREGFEAVLVLIALLGVVRTAKNRRAARSIHLGWMSALLLGVVTWLFSGWLLSMSTAQRELMEGFTAILAVFILLYMGFWLHSKTEITRWRMFIDDRVQNAMKEGNFWGLAAISFTAVFREAFETVLFLRALWLEGGEGTKFAMALGVAFAFAVIFSFTWIALRYATRIPIRSLFGLSSAVMIGLAAVLIGKGMHSFQETGIVPMTAIPFSLRLDLLGLYPTFETWASQAALLAIAALLWIYTNRPSGPARA